MTQRGYLQKVLTSLSFAARQAGDLPEDNAAWQWLTIGLTMALEASLVVALSSYETADPKDVLDPSDPTGEKRAPVTLMLRRVRSTEYLNPPERLSLPVSASKGAEKLLTYRNAVMHGPYTGDAPQQIARYALHCLNIIDYLILKHPAFEQSVYAIEMPLIADHVDAIRRQIAAPG